MKRTLNDLVAGDDVTVVNAGVPIRVAKVTVAKPLWVELANGERFSRDTGRLLRGKHLGCKIRLPESVDIALLNQEFFNTQAQEADFVLSLLTMQNALTATIQGIITSKIDRKLGDPSQVPHGFDVLIGIIQAQQEKMGLILKPAPPEKQEARENILASVIRELRDGARGLCEAAQDTRGINYERLYNCVWAIEKSEKTVPSLGLSTTMLSTEELRERNRASRR